MDKTFEIIPAIDLLKGCCVRLKQGRYDAEKLYSKDPVTVAQTWASQGAKRLHLVDLDGARTGIPQNIELIKKIAQTVKLPLQVGGGIRNLDTIKSLLEVGVDRIILGTTAVKNPNTLATFCQEFGETIVVAIDARDGKAATEGWTQVSKKDIFTLAQEAIDLGVKRFIYTEISRDGMLEGPDFSGISNFAAKVAVPVIVAGGVSAKTDIEKLKEIGVAGFILGKALYEGSIKLEEVLPALSL